MASTRPISYILRPSPSRKHFELDWLNSKHSFSPAFSQPSYKNFGCIIAVGEDIVAPSSGFSTHTHKDTEIFSYGLKSLYHTGTFRQQEKRDGFATIISPVKAGPGASPAEDKAPEPIVPGTIPIHADFLFGATIITKGKIHTWTVRGRDIVRSKQNRKVDVHFPEMGGGKGVIRLGGKAGIDLYEGDGAYVTGVKAGDEIEFESIGST
ncbi:hypothetical protein DL95DRAFT_430448 [Leptodontidium sp. 2 PMI_412]|nr:hypothetical protein DL95DRAFT_430448 [Leptodontidium sp. 2 PMI_412]